MQYRERAGDRHLQAEQQSHEMHQHEVGVEDAPEVGSAHFIRHGIVRFVIAIAFPRFDLARPFPIYTAATAPSFPLLPRSYAV